MPSNKPLQRLEDIIDDIDRIRAYVVGLDADQFATGGMVRDAVERCFTRISEAAVKLGDQMDRRYPTIPWPNIRALGNVLRHGYDIVDDRVLWRTIQVQLQPLRDACDAELSALRSGASFDRG